MTPWRLEWLRLVRTQRWMIVAGVASLAVDARPELAAFLRTRVPRARTLLLPRYVATLGVAAAGLVAGTAVAWGLTALLIGSLPVGAMLVGTAFGVLYLAFAVAVLAAVSGFTRSQPTAVFAALGILLALPIVGLVPVVQPWLPSQLLSAVAAMVEGVPAGEFVRSAITAVAGTAALLALATRQFGRREL